MQGIPDPFIFRVPHKRVNYSRLVDDISQLLLPLGLWPDTRGLDE